MQKGQILCSVVVTNYTLLLAFLCVFKLQLRRGPHPSHAPKSLASLLAIDHARKPASSNLERDFFHEGRARLIKSLATPKGEGGFT